jgi:hypothetical protein
MMEAYFERAHNRPLCDIRVVVIVVSVDSANVDG